MNQSSRIKSPDIVEFGPFCFDMDAHLLSRGGKTLPLKRQSAAVLALLVDAGGSVVTRAAIRDAVWHNRTIEFDDGINACVRDIRRVLGDSSRSPTYVETIPKRGYRLKAMGESKAETHGWALRGWGMLVGGALLAVAITVFLMVRQPAPPETTSERDRIAVMPFTAADASTAPSAQIELLTNLFVAMLAEHQSKILVISIGELFADDDSPPGMGDVSRWLSVDYLLAGSVVENAEETLLTLRVVRTDGYVHLWSKTMPLDPKDPTVTARQLFTQMLEFAREENGELLFKDPPAT